MCEMKEILTNFKADWKPFSFFLLIRTNSVGDLIVIEIKSTEWFHFLWHFCCLSFWSNLMKLAIGTGHVADVLTLWWTERDDDIAWPYRKRYWFLNEGRLYFHERWPTTPTTKQKKKQKNKKKIQEWETHVHNDDQITTRCYVKCSPASFCYVFISITSKIIQYR